MISAHFVKTRLLELIEARPEFQTVACLYGMPESDGDIAGTDPIMRQGFGFDNPDGLFSADEVCGPLTQTFTERYDMDFVVQVIARNRDATPATCEARRSLLVWGVAQALQDSTLGFVAADDPKISQIQVQLGEAFGYSGWLPASATNLAASRAHVELKIEAVIANE